MSRIGIDQIEDLSAAAIAAKNNWERAVSQLAELQGSEPNNSAELQRATEQLEDARILLEKESLQLIGKLCQLIDSQHTPPPGYPEVETRWREESAPVVPPVESHPLFEPPTLGVIVPIQIRVSSMVQGEGIKLAIYKKPVLHPTLATIAWQVISLNYDEVAVVDVPAEFKLQAQYPSGFSGSIFAAPVLDESSVSEAFSDITSSFRIEKNKHELPSDKLLFTKVSDGLVDGEMHIKNDFDVGVQVTVYRGDDAMYEPQVIWPGGLFMEAPAGQLHVAVVSQFTQKGQRLVQEEIAVTEFAFRGGETLAITGSKWKGYRIEKR
ncbi:MAG: hypothetical protein ACN6QH_20690 [Pseudomonas sp.]|uniref:hypothetical protein n=1 Tax=Pseudomonas sp. TaxID=306 RepID=UPI003D1315DD